jgi:hypothetical protein
MKVLLFLMGFLFFVAMSCSHKQKHINLDSWDGNYGYSEKPIKATAGYSMIMDWSLSIRTKEKNNEGILEVGGQQTYIKSKIKVTGDTNMIAILFDSLVDGRDQERQKGDTLFLLSKNAGSLITKWFSMESILPENSPRECICFTRQ